MRPIASKVVATVVSGVLLAVLVLAAACGSQPAPPAGEARPTLPESGGYPGPSVDQPAQEPAGYPAPAMAQPTPTATPPGYPAPPTPTVEPAQPTGYPAPQTPAGAPGAGVSVDDLDLDEANVLFVTAVQTADGTWGFEVTVRHHDEGWDHYADGWDVVTPDGTVLKTTSDDAFTRVLLHPHETEQPFTREQSGLTIPDDVTQVTVRAHCNVHGFGGREVVVDLTAEGGPDFQVEHQQ